MSISLSDELRAFVEAQAARGGFGTVEDYVETLIREARERQARREHVETLLQEGLDSGPATPWTEGDRDAIRSEVHRRHAERQGPRGRAGDAGDR